MGHKIFISYKFKDISVCQTINHNLFEKTERKFITPRDYVNILQKYIEEYTEHIYKGEDDNNPLIGKSEEWIWEELKDSMFDSTLTIVIISPNMKTNEPEREQWIPWEISYSLSNETRKNSAGNPIKSATNALFAVVLPDRNGKYDYYFEKKTCCENGCTLHKTNKLFKILQDNTFNKKYPDLSENICANKSKLYVGEYNSYIHFYKWDEVKEKNSFQKAIDLAYEIQSQKDKYNISYEVD